MIPELGLVALCFALALSFVLSVVPLTASFFGDVRLMRLASSSSLAIFFCVAVSFVCLSYSFAIDDFSVAYVAGHSNTLLPLHFKLSAVWGGHEGSLLLWVLILVGWIAAVATRSKALPLVVRARVLSVMGMIAVGFLLFTIMTSNPFERHLPTAPLEGRDLNPLLQDIGLIIHPPMLYFGYVGFSVAFAFAITALIGGKLDAAWARWARPWTNMAWFFLTIGITLGSWWAYYELGWGGWWFWDPVENASFMPWLVGTALVHSLAATEKRGAFKSWTLLLAIFAFSLSLLGTFLVRSGVLTSVHAFASDPARGLFILIFLCIVVGGSLLLYALRAPQASVRVSFGLLSREMFLLLNNVVLVVATITVLLGTLFPLAADAFGWGKYSVGPPYFNLLFVPLMAFLMSVMAVGPLLNWKKNQQRKLLHSLIAPAISALVVGLILPFAVGRAFNVSVMLVGVICCWILAAMVQDIRTKIRTADSPIKGLSKLRISYWGMITAHVGMIVCAVGVVFVSQYDEERDVRMEPGDSLEVAGYVFEFDGAVGARGPNYVADVATLKVSYDGRHITHLYPERRKYFSSDQIMTEAAIDPGFSRDLFVALGEHRGGDAWAVRIQVKPLVRWLWVGGFLMGVGGLMAVFDRRYRNMSAKVSA